MPNRRTGHAAARRRATVPAIRRRPGAGPRPPGIPTLVDGAIGPAAGARPHVVGIVDVGSNSVHLLVARVVQHDLEPLADASAFLGLGAAIGEGGALGADRRAILASAVASYAATARDLGADHFALLGTEPIRRAADAGRILFEAERASGMPFHVLSHEEEAELTAIGVTAGRQVGADVLVVDIGGGSTEFILVSPDRAPRAWGLRIGGARLTERHVRHDPPTAAELDVLRERARARVAASDAAAPSELVAVGGTASNVARLLAVPGAAPSRWAQSASGAAPPRLPALTGARAGAPDVIVTASQLGAAMARLAAAPASELAAAHALNPRRTPILAAGVAIIEAIMAHYGVDRFRVSEAGIREGAALALVKAGPSWRDRLPTLAAGWRR